MKQPIRLFLILSASALFATACSTAPYEDSADTIGTNYSGSANIPEAGPLTGTSNTYVQPQANYHAPAYQAPAVAYQQPQAPANNQYAYNQPPQAPRVQVQAQPAYDPYAASGYDTGATNPAPDYAAAPAAASGYDYAAGGGNGTYNSYGGAAAAAPATNYASNSNTGDYYSGGGSNAAPAAPAYAPATSSGSAGGSSGSGGSAVQLFASGSSTKANEVMQSMQSRGLQAIVDQVDGLYKVRIPFGTESEARANLIRVRSASGESGAFVTYR